MPIKYTDELKQHAVELVIHAQANPDTAHGAVRRVADELEVENRRLRAELAEAKRANDILKKASAFSRRSVSAHKSSCRFHR